MATARDILHHPNVALGFSRITTATATFLSIKIIIIIIIDSHAAALQPSALLATSHAPMDETYSLFATADVTIEAFTMGPPLPSAAGPPSPPAAPAEGTLGAAAIADLVEVPPVVLPEHRPSAASTWRHCGGQDEAVTSVAGEADISTTVTHVGRKNDEGGDEDEDEDETFAGRSFRPDVSKVRRKMASLPTLEKLMAEKDPNAYTEEQLQLAILFAERLCASTPSTTDDVQRELRKLQKIHRVVLKKSLLLAGYKALCTRPARDTAATATADEAAPDATLSQPLVRFSNMVQRNEVVESFLVSKAPRSQSGVLVVTVFTSAYPDGQTFSCKWNCYYCPNEPGQPRSYLLNEPGVRRANQLHFDPYRQFRERVRNLVAIGHPADKVELLVLGGTWESYPPHYRERFIRDLFYAANTLYDEEDDGGTAEPAIGAMGAEESGRSSGCGGTAVDGSTSRTAACAGVEDVPPGIVPGGHSMRRPPLDLAQEQLLNESARCKIIGVTLETRPDTINAEALVQLRRYGCTRVQLGVQHTDESILTLVNRQAYREHTVQAIKLLKDSCFKVDIHLMPDLPGTTTDTDKRMFDDVLFTPDLQADQWKIYPCQTTPFTVIQRWYEEGKYKPYELEELVDVLLYAKRRVHPWIRLNRVIRDIPVDYVLAGVEVANLRQLLGHRMAVETDTYGCCRCIRCREVKGDTATVAKLSAAVLMERYYDASGAREVFLSVETTDQHTVFGFLRLRLARDASGHRWDTPFEELQGCALIRELHVYGNLITTSGEGQVHAKAQHMGIGSRLLEHAEQLARRAGYTKIAVISGVGVRHYYARKGYEMVDVHRGAFLIKPLPADLPAPRVTVEGRETVSHGPRYVAAPSLSALQVVARVVPLAGGGADAGPVAAVPRDGAPSARASEGREASLNSSRFVSPRPTELPTAECHRPSESRPSVPASDSPGFVSARSTGALEPAVSPSESVAPRGSPHRASPARRSDAATATPQQRFSSQLEAVDILPAASRDREEAADAVGASLEALQSKWVQLHEEHARLHRSSERMLSGRSSVIEMSDPATARCSPRPSRVVAAAPRSSTFEPPWELEDGAVGEATARGPDDAVPRPGPRADDAPYAGSAPWPSRWLSRVTSWFSGWKRQREPDDEDGAEL